MSFDILKSFVVTIVVGTMILVGGCGSSQDDAFMRAAMRSRSDADDTPTPPPATTTDSAAQPAGPAQGNQPATESAKTADPNVPAQPSSPAVTGGTPQAPNPIASDESIDLKVTPIDQRRPTQPLDDAQRVKRSVDNIRQIGKAVRKYIDRTGFVPPHILKTKAGGEMLSWRVAILPDLGYQELYDAFDLEQPWDSDVNSKLLDRIPDCFVSPERFDTSTNYQAIVGNNYVFRKLTMDRGSITDGLENTLAFVEVEDRLAVPWTCPQDYESPWETFTDGVAKFRPEGFFGIWASGAPTLIRANVEPAKILNALTPDGGDGQLASAIHQPVIPIAGASMASVTSDADTKAAVSNTNGSPSAKLSPTPGTGPATAPAQNLPRLPAPKEILVQKAIERVQSLYSGRFKEARQLSDRTTIANEMLDTAVLMREDPAGAYAMQEAVMSVATAMGDFSLLVKAIDGRVQMFEIDAIAENAQRLVEFTKSNSGPIAAQIDQNDLMRRCIPVIAESIRKDSYDLPIELVRHLITMDRMAKKRGGDIGIGQLKTQLGVAKGYLDQATDAIVTLRSDESDPVSNGAVGRYTAFIKGDWKPGLEMLVLGDNEKLASMAKADLNASSDPQQMLGVADAWYDLGKSTSNKVFRGGCYERAAHWYTTAHNALPESLSKVHAKTRMAESNSAATGSPLALVQQIAEYIGFDLDQEIEMIKNPAAKAIQNNTYEE